MEKNITKLSGPEILHDPRFNKGTAFTEAERDALKLRGLLPPHVFTQDEQEARVLENYRRKTSDIEKYIFLISLQDRNEKLFYRTVLQNIDEMMPIIYTPTVGEACKQFAHIFRRPRGLYISARDRGRIEQILRNWPKRNVRVIVVTDGERILGLGDLGANGMGIPVGKLALYTVCAGIDPDQCLPIMLDVGTNNEDLLNDPLYLGIPRQRLRGPDYDALVEELVVAVQTVFPKALFQFEDFANTNALPLLEKYRNRLCCFNDDIQGTAAVTLAGLLSAIRIQGRRLKDQTFLFLGAGSAGRGIADLLVSAMRQDGLPENEARRHCWLVDSTGLVVKGRQRLQNHKIPYAHDHEFLPDLLAAVRNIRPTVLIGVSGQAQAFNQAVLEAMADINPIPIIFALSNPTSKAECVAEDAYRWTKAKAVFAGGSPFDPVKLGNRTLVPGQCNNAYIFPGIGLGIIASGAARVTDAVFLAAAQALSSQVTEQAIAEGRIFPPLTTIRDVSAVVAANVAEAARGESQPRTPPSAESVARMRSLMYTAQYDSFA